MPLIITLAFFGVLFSLEACEELAQRDHARHAIERYERVEHPRANRSDLYLDHLG